MLEVERIGRSGSGLLRWTRSMDIGRDIGLDTATVTALETVDESQFISQGSTSVDMDTADSPASASASASAGAPAGSTPMSATSPAPSGSRSSAGKRKRGNSIADLTSAMVNMHDEAMRLLERQHDQRQEHHQEYMQHLRQVAADVRADACEALEQDAALRREELTEMSSFNRDFLTLFGRLMDTFSSRRV
ncbi:uncharacterized protein KZ484_011029 [Pholidichthys leucotaenia]